MRHGFNIIIASILSFCAVIGCNDVSATLRHAEAIIQDKPDSALCLIKSIDTTRIKTLRQKADYSLLLTMALDKNYIDVTDVKILEPALKYYSHKGNSINKAKVKYYEGIIYYRSKRYEEAVVALLDALRISSTTSDFWLNGMICSGLARAYNKSYNRADELKYREMAYDYFASYGDSLYINSAVLSWAVALHNNERFAESDSLFTLIPAQSEYYSSSLLFRADNEIKRPDRNAYKARQLFESAIQKGKTLSSEQNYLYAYSLALTGDIEQADRILSALTESRFPVEDWWLYLIRKYEGRNDESFKHLEKYIYAQDSLVKANLAQSLYKAESEHQQLVAEKASAERDRITALLIILVFAGLLLVSLIILIGQRRRIHLQQEYSDLMSKFVDSQRMIDSIKTSQEDKLASFVTMYRQRMSGIGEMYNRSVAIANLLGDADLSYHNEAKAVIEAIPRPKEFEALVNKDLNGIMQKIRADFPSLDEDSYRLLSLIIVGFKDKSIERILGLKSGTLRSRKSRIRKLILDSDTSNHWLYEAFLK